MASTAAKKQYQDRFIEQIDRLLLDQADASIADEWRSNAKLIAAREKFFGLLAANPNERMRGLLDADNHIRHHMRDIEYMIRYFEKPPFLIYCTEDMQTLAAEGEPILLLRNRYEAPPQFVPIDPQSDVVVSMTMDDREAQGKKEKMILDEKAGFDKVMSEERRQQKQFRCKLCGKLGQVTPTSVMTRGADEDMTIFELCRLCTETKKT